VDAGNFDYGDSRVGELGRARSDYLPLDLGGRGFQNHAANLVPLVVVDAQPAHQAIAASRDG
jgi:hypothetical protein